MKYMIKHSCEHEERVDLFGTNVHGERDRKAAYLASKPCYECEMAAAESEYELCDLTGSEKQIAWARRIRAAAIKDVEEKLDSAAKMDLSDTEHKIVTDKSAAIRKFYKTQGSAAWWIDNRSSTDIALARAVR